jgi:hypothetical protein
MQYAPDDVMGSMETLVECMSKCVSRLALYDTAVNEGDGVKGVKLQ